MDMPAHLDKCPKLRAKLLKAKQDNTGEVISANFDPDQNGLMQCKFCERKFTADRILKHQNICKKVKHKPNSVTKNVNLRNERDEWGNKPIVLPIRSKLDRLHNVNGSNNKNMRSNKDSNSKPLKPIQSSNWRDQSNQLRSIIKLNRNVDQPNHSKVMDPREQRKQAEMRKELDSIMNRNLRPCK
eukprot:CAMPEP_0116899900 /NCGR_PEP_ID=MMETSP0467-20121206/8371_1 /TAXON_ID=283647 /ORGANISM="Mesodinium pulex, Strain SPMC105" /LENGTH=184 /DNA_ID=CAMNT_0004572987 /DNA_START=139 /DNA_END=693 /DNA_ORIENTATION=+